MQREKKRAKAQLEFNLVTAMKDNKKYFYKYINNKMRWEDTEKNTTTP